MISGVLNKSFLGGAMKRSLIAIIALAASFQAFGQDSLMRCQARSEKLQERVTDLNRQLSQCERNNGGGNSSEVFMLRNENARLSQENRLLQIRIDQLEGRGYEQFLCVAGCKDLYGKIDTRYMSSATAYSQLEADMLAKQNTQKTFSCNYGVNTYKCESFTSEIQSAFCTAGCVDLYGKVDERYAGGARGRNRLEAEISALKDVQKQHSCNYGVKVIACN